MDIAADDMNYVAILPCGHLTGIIHDDPQFTTDTAKYIAAWIRRGAKIERISTADVHAGKLPKFCRCPKKGKRGGYDQRA